VIQLKLAEQVIDRSVVGVMQVRPGASLDLAA
jgi:hypothetical protein